MNSEANQSGSLGSFQIQPGGGGGGGYSTKFHTRRFLPEVQHLTTLHTIFDRKGPSFVYLPLPNGTPFTYPVRTIVPLLTAVDALSFKYEKEITIPGNLFTFFIAIISLISSFRSFYRRKRHISLSFHILHLVESLPFHTSEAWKRYPFWAEPLRIGHYRDYPPRVKRQVNTRRETKGHSIFL